MIKGVNKQVLEITNTENPYFERIVFFVKPEYKGAEKPGGKFAILLPRQFFVSGQGRRLLFC